MRPRAEDLATRRLLLRPATLALLRAELEGNRALAAALGVVVPDGWPPGEHTRYAVQFFLDSPALLSSGWSNYYGIARATASTPATLVVSVGFHGQPDGAGRVELGYSVVENWRDRGLATESVAALLARARGKGARCVIAHARPDNQASLAVLSKSGFVPAVSTRDGQLGFEHWLFAIRRARAAEESAVNALYTTIDFQPSTSADLQLVADCGGELVALGRLSAGASDTGDCRELGGIWVAPHLRGSGVARAMVTALIEQAEGRTLACLPFARLEAFYASFGFARWDRELAPVRLQRKLDFCAATYAEPVFLMRRQARK